MHVKFQYSTPLAQFKSFTDTVNFAIYKHDMEEWKLRIV